MRAGWCMSDPEVAAAAQGWLAYAAADLQAAEVLLGQRDVSARIACFHAQQAAEKAIKALLIANQIRVQHIHDLVELVGALPPGTDPGASNPALADLSIWAVEFRYPGDIAEATLADAENAMATARGVVAAATAALT